MNKKLNRWISVLGIVILALALAACSGASQGRPEDEVSEASSGVVNIRATDFEFTIDATQARAGTVTFVLQNDGHMPHDFPISGNGVEQKTPLIIGE